MIKTINKHLIQYTCAQKIIEMLRQLFNVSIHHTKPLYLKPRFHAIYKCMRQLNQIQYATTSTAEATSPETITTHSFKTETKRLLEIVANSLYSEKEIFVRELVSNSSDACEKLRYMRLAQPESLVPEDNDHPLGIHITLDEEKKLFIIQDYGIGMTSQELMDNIGTIAMSGTKKFAEEASSDSQHSGNLIGQFGVGFYSAFTVGKHVQVFSLSAKKESSQGYCWESNGQGEFTLQKVDNLPVGTKIIVHLRDSDSEYSSNKRIENIIKKYSNFINFPIFINGTQFNTVKPIWMMEKNDIKEDQYNEFFKFMCEESKIVNRGYAFKLFFSTDSPLQIRSILYIPNHIQMINSANLEDMTNISLYSKRVLIKQKAHDLLPNWLCFVHGVVECEDIPLNLSRELLQNNLLIQKIKRVLTLRVIRWLQDEQKSNPDRFASLYRKMDPYLKGGILQDPVNKKDIINLLMFECSGSNPNSLISLKDYTSMLPEGHSEIYIYITQNRDSAMNSSYMESFLKKGIPVLLSYNRMDELLLPSLDEYDGKKFVRIEDVKSNVIENKDDTTTQGDDLVAEDYIKSILGTQVSHAKPATRTFTPPFLIVDHTASSMSMKYFAELLREHSGEGGEESTKAPIPPVQLEFNKTHPVILGILRIKDQKPELASLLVKQSFDMALMEAGLMEQVHPVIKRMDTLLSALINKI